MHFPLIVTDHVFGYDQLLAFLVLDDAASSEQLVFVNRDKAEFAEELAEFSFLGALGGIEGVVRVLGVAHESLLYIMLAST